VLEDLWVGQESATNRPAGVRFSAQAFGHLQFKRSMKQQECRLVELQCGAIELADVSQVNPLLAGVYALMLRVRCRIHSLIAVNVVASSYFRGPKKGANADMVEQLDRR